MKLSEHFSRDEFSCKCGCGFSTVDVKLIEILESVRSQFKKPVKINSGCRCHDHNKKVGGTPKSKHMEGIAADIVVKGVSPIDVHKFLIDYVGGNYAGIGRYETFVHIDARENPARW